MDTNCWLRPQLGRVSSTPLAMRSRTIPNHFRIMLAPGTERAGGTHFGGQWVNVVNAGTKSNRRKASASPPDRLRHETHELAHILLGRIERTHPTHDALLLDPGIEEILLFDRLHRVSRDLREYSVRLNLPGDLDLGNFSQLRLQHPRHAVGMLRAPPPQVISQQRFELRGHEPHLRRQLHPLLP